MLSILERFPEPSPSDSEAAYFVWVAVLLCSTPCPRPQTMIILKAMKETTDSDKRRKP